ncbi:15717_t:CDS:2, partial [Entrophospora sp. SA101]
DDDKEILSDEDIIDDNSGCRTPVNQIKSDKLLRAAAESLASPDESKYFKEFIIYFNEYKETQLNNPYSCTNDDVMDICGESGFSNSMPLERYIKLMSIKPKRIAEIPECWKQILNDYFSETISSGGSPKTIHDWVKVTDELNAVKDSDSDEAIKFKKYLNCVMSPLIESFLKPLPDISSPDTSEHHYWAEFAHRFFSKALQYFANLDWRILEVPVYASKYRKNFGLNHALEKVVDGKFADILARTWDTKEELFVGEQAGAPTNPDLTKYATDWFKLYRELRD